MEYIYFLDSDDWLELECIEECVELASKNQAQIVWHGCKYFYEITGQINEADFPKKLGLNEGKNYDGLEILSQLSYPSFSWATMGIVAINFVNKLRFQERIESEDALFGMQVFALAQRVQLLFNPLYNYRIRPNSISQHTLSHTNNQGLSFPSHQKDLVDAFNGDAYTIRHYSFAYSCAIICLRMDEFIKKEKISNELRKILKAMIEVRAIYAFGGCGFEKDPRNVRELCSKLKAYTARVRWTSMFAYYLPCVYRILKRLATGIKDKYLYSNARKGE